MLVVRQTQTLTLTLAMSSCITLLPFSRPLFSLIKPLFLNPTIPKPKPKPNLLLLSFSTSATSIPQISTSNSPKLDFDVVGPYLSCSMPGQHLKVAVLVSGGVDSSVALRLLHAAGHSCTAFYLKIWFQEDFENFWSECPWEEDLAYVKAVCNQVDVPLEVVHLTDEYWEKVVSYIIEEYRNGRTPNPDVLCNTRIKFGAFMDAISNMGFDYVASGHYANVRHPSAEDPGRPSTLELSRDVVKDQTYFLSHLDQCQLRRLLFPLGKIPKDEVRKLATQFFLPNQDRKDSQGICFLGKIKFSDFVARQIGEMEGVILEAETGDFLGKHRGFWFYTIGQRQGLRLPGGPWFVVEKDTKNNVVFVSRSYYSGDKRRRVFRVGSLKWLSGLSPLNLSELQCKVRHGPSLYKCSLILESCEYGPGDIGVVHLSEDDQGLAAGQFAAFYQGNTCIGSGIILESWDDQGFPVCEKALEIARLPDKSKLGKPIKIKVRHGPSLYKCSLILESCEYGPGDIGVVHLSEDDQGLAAGQFAAFYQGNTCIGSGIILESWDDQGFPVCEKALEIARLPDKSKLGKPIKIKVKPDDPQLCAQQNAGQNNSSNKTSKKSEVEQKMSTSPSLNWMQKIKHIFFRLF